MISVWKAQPHTVSSRMIKKDRPAILLAFIGRFPGTFINVKPVGVITLTAGMLT